MNLLSFVRRLRAAWLAPSFVGLWLASGAVAGGAVLGSAAAGGLQVGDAVAFKFRQPVLNGRGIASLADFAGKPLLVEYWGTRCPPCINGAVPSALKLQETYGDDLQVLFVELQNSGPERVASFALERRWLGGRALWTSELVIDAGISTLPAFVLVGSDGRVLLKGSPFSLQKELERLVQDGIKRLRTPPESVPPLLRPAWLEFHSGRYARGIDMARALALREDLDSEARAVVAAAETRLYADLDRRLVRAEWLLQHGYLAEANDACDALRAGLTGLEGLSTRAEALLTRLQAPEARPLREAERALTRLQERLFTSGGDVTVVRELEAFAATQSSNCLAKRARELVGIAQPKNPGR